MRRFLNNFNIILLLSPLGKGCGPSFEQNWIPFFQEFFVPSLDKIVQMVLEEKMFIYFQYNLHFCYYLPLGKGGAFHLNKHESPPSIFVSCMINLPSGSREEDFIIFSINSTFSLLSHLGKAWPFIWTKDALCQVWLKLAQWLLRRCWKCEKFTDGQTDNRQQATRKAHLSFQLSAQVS